MYQLQPQIELSYDYSVVGQEVETVICRNMFMLGKDDRAIEKAEHMNLISAVKEVGSQIKFFLFWSLAEEQDTMLHKLLLAADVFVIRGFEDHNYVTQEDIYKEDEMDEEIKREQEKKKVFAQLVLNNLSNIRVYFIG